MLFRSVTTSACKSSAGVSAAHLGDPQMVKVASGYIAFAHDSGNQTSPPFTRFVCGLTSTDGNTWTVDAGKTVSLSTDIQTNPETYRNRSGVIEQILPMFPPEYTLSINAIPDMNVVQDIPVILNNISVMDEYEGDFQTRRFVTHTLDFTLKLNLFGPEQTSKVISKVMANVSENPLYDPDSANYTAVGDVTTGNITSENWIEHL